MRAAFLMFSPPQYRLVVTTTTKLGTLAFRLDHDQPFEDWDNLRKFTNVIIEKGTIGTASVWAVNGGCLWNAVPGIAATDPINIAEFIRPERGSVMKVWTLYDQDIGSEGICVFDSKATLARYIRENYAEKLANDFAGDFDMLSDDGLLQVAKDAGFWFNKQELKTMATMDEDEEDWAKIRIATMGEAKNDEYEDIADDPETPANRAS